MPPISDTERQKLLLQQEIAKLSGAISRHATSNPHPNAYHPYAYRGRGRGRGRGGRGRGRGAYTLDNTRSGPSSATEKEDGEVTPPQDWVKKTSRGGNMSLMTVEKRNQLAARPPPVRKPKVPANVEVLQSTSESSPTGTENKRVVIDGVIFQFEQDGSKLVRIGELEPGASTQGTPTRQSLSYGGEKYRRTKRGNLISSSSRSLRRAEQAKKPCRYFTKTGRCDRALTCPYKHEADRIAICPRFLRGACPLGAGACPLSHTPSAHNTPSCVHFQANATCRNGDKCLYPHVRVSEDAPVCEAFAREGWCDAEAGTCPDLHIWECPEWHDKGTCSRGTRCGLRHILRREKTTAAKPTPQAVGGFEDQSEFIGLPGEVVSETSDSEEDEGDEDGSDGSDEGEDDDEENEGGDEEKEGGNKEESMELDENTGKLPSDTDDDDDELRVLGEV